MFDFLDQAEGQPHLRYSLATMYPTRVFRGADDLAASLADLGLAPQAALLLQPEEEEAGAEAVGGGAGEGKKEA